MSKRTSPAPEKAGRAMGTLKECEPHGKAAAIGAHSAYSGEESVVRENVLTPGRKTWNFPRKLT